LPEQGRDWLSGTLRKLREDAGLSGNQAAKLASISQSQLSRIETGRFLPSDDAIRKLCKLYRAPAAVRAELLQAVADLRPETVQARVVLSRGGWKLQQRFGRIEEASAEICGYQPALIPGLLQTPDYMRVVFGSGMSGDDLDRAVAARMARASVLDSGRTFTFIVAEGALRWQAGSPQVMLRQLDHLTEVIRARPNVRFGVIPQSRPAEVFTTHGFSLYDRRTVIVGIWTGTTFIADPKDVAEYSKLFGELEELAVYGEDAVTVIRQVATGYRLMLS
jgi:transcriptional regulator with XRE-family HTH domain